MFPLGIRTSRRSGSGASQATIAIVRAHARILSCQSDKLPSIPVHACPVPVLSIDRGPVRSSGDSAFGTTVGCLAEHVRLFTSPHLGRPNVTCLFHSGSGDELACAP